MSVMLNWKIAMEVEGAWTEQAIQDLNTAMNDWWCDWCEYADFFWNISFPGTEHVFVVNGCSDTIAFDALVDFSANGDMECLIKGGRDPLEKREKFDRTVHQRLLDSMNTHKSVIKFTVKEECEGDPEEWHITGYKVTSDGNRFVVAEDVGDFEFGEEFDEAY